MWFVSAMKLNCQCNMKEKQYPQAHENFRFGGGAAANIDNIEKCLFIKNVHYDTQQMIIICSLCECVTNKAVMRYSICCVT